MKKTSIAFILAFLSQSALASDDFEIKNLDILAYSGSQDVSLMDAISGDQWDVSYDYATRKGNEYQVQLRVKPKVNDVLEGREVSDTGSSNLVIGPFTVPLSLDAYNNFSKMPESLPGYLNNLLPMMPLNIWGESVNVDIQSITFDETTRDVIIKINFESEKEIENLPIVAGFTGIWLKGVTHTTFSAAVGKAVGRSSLSCDETTKVCSVKLVKTSDPSSQIFPISNKD